MAVAKELGFENEDALDRAKQFTLMPREEQIRVIKEYEYNKRTLLPEHEPSDSDRRYQRVKEIALVASVKRTELRSRSVVIGLESTKDEADQYLSEQYTNPDGEMICQICKKPLPFKLDDGTYYFESIKLLDELTKMHYQNYVALCPNHAAMFMYTNGSKEQLGNAIIETNSTELEVTLARNQNTIYFTKTHLTDLKALIDVEQGQLSDKEK